MEFENMRNFFNGNPSNKTPFNTDPPLNTPGGLGKEIKGNMQGMNILGRLQIDHWGKMVGQMFKDSRIETNIIGVTSVPKFLQDTTFNQ